MDFHDFSRCALAPPQRGRRRKNTKNNIKTTSTNRLKKATFPYIFRAGRPCSKNAPKMTSGSLSGTLPGASGRAKSLHLSAKGPPEGTDKIDFPLPEASRGDFGGSREGNIGFPWCVPCSSGSRGSSRNHFGAILHYV